MRLITLKTLLGLLLATASFAHEGHDSPDTLPLAPHGGKVKLAPTIKDVLGKGPKPSAVELFFEVAYANKTLSVYPLVLSSNHNDFQKAPPADMTNVKVRVKSSKGQKVLPLTSTATGWTAPYDPRGLNWIHVYISATHKNAFKETKIQFEFNQ